MARIVKLLVHPTQIDHAVDLPDQMIRRHYLVEIKRVKELPLSTLSPPHHGSLPRITSQSDGITVRPWSQREFCNTFPPKADKEQTCRYVRFVPCVDGSELARLFCRSQASRCSHVFGPLARRTRPLAIMPSADQVPVKSPHSRCTGTSGLS